MIRPAVIDSMRATSPGISETAAEAPRIAVRSPAALATAKSVARIPDDLREELVALRRSDNWRNFLYMGADLSLIAATVGACLTTGMHPLAYATALLLIGSRQRALMNLVHQASHRKLFASRMLNDRAAELLAAFPLAISLSGYTRAHSRHHGSLGDPTYDPKSVRYAQLGLISPMADGEGRFWLRHVVRPLLLLHAPFNVRAALSSMGEPRTETVRRATFCVLVAMGAVSTGLVDELLLFWVVPYLTTFQLLRYFAEMAEHAGLSSDDPWLATRNWHGMFLTRFLLAPHSDNYHLTHHICPGIPHYRMGAAHRVLMQVSEYAGAHQCDGFFFRRSARAPSVWEDIRHPGRRASLARGEPLLVGGGTSVADGGTDAQTAP